MNKNLKLIILSCLLFSMAALSLACTALWKNQEFPARNHSILFGTPLESFLMSHSLIIPIIACLPLIIPFLLRRKKIFLLVAACAFPLYLFIRHSISILTD